MRERHHTQRTIDELHSNVREFSGIDSTLYVGAVEVPESKSKGKSFAKRLAQLGVAGVAAVAVGVSMLNLSVRCVDKSLAPDNTQIFVRVDTGVITQVDAAESEAPPEPETVAWRLTDKGGAEVVHTGEIPCADVLLTFTDLAYDTAYTLTFFGAAGEDGTVPVLCSHSFRTAKREANAPLPEESTAPIPAPTPTPPPSPTPEPEPLPEPEPTPEPAPEPDPIPEPDPTPTPDDDGPPVNQGSLLPYEGWEAVQEISTMWISFSNDAGSDIDSSTVTPTLTVDGEDGEAMIADAGFQSDDKTMYTMEINYGGLTVGTHTLTATLHYTDTDGTEQLAVAEATVTVYATPTISTAVGEYDAMLGTYPVTVTLQGAYDATKVTAISAEAAVGDGTATSAIGTYDAGTFTFSTTVYVTPGMESTINGTVIVTSADGKVDYPVSQTVTAPAAP